MNHDVPIMLEGLSESERTRYLIEMSEGYKRAGEDAELRRQAAEDAKNAVEERAWRHVAIHCEMMSALVKQGILDEPNDNHLSFYAFDERIARLFFVCIVEYGLWYDQLHIKKRRIAINRMV
jgi:hypothetical protein